MSRPTQLYKNSTRICVSLGFLGNPVITTGLSVVLTRIGASCETHCRPCDKNVFVCEDVEEEVPETPVPVANSVTLPLIEQRPDGSLCALITTELAPLKAGRYTARIEGNPACKQCFQVELLDTCPTSLTSYSETPDTCIACEIAPPPAPAPAPGPAPYTLATDRPLWTH